MVTCQDRKIMKKGRSSNQQQHRQDLEFIELRLHLGNSIFF